MENLGVLSALGAALAWGSYMVPFKKAGSIHPILFQVWMGVGILISGAFLSLLAGYPLSLNIYGVAAGICWGVANYISLAAVSNLGLSRGVPLMSSLVILVSFLWGALVFGELPSGMAMGSTGIVLIIIGVAIVSSTGGAASVNLKKGLIAALIAGSLFGSQLVPIKIGKLVASDYYFSMSLGIFIMATLIGISKGVKLKKIALKESLTSGVIWNIGNLAGVISVSLIGLSKGFPITQSAVLIAVLWGIFYFKEITSKRLIFRVLFGAMILLSGVILLGLA